MCHVGQYAGPAVQGGAEHDSAPLAEEQRKVHVVSLLADTDMPFQEIADTCGFAIPSYLWDFCKKHLKATPAEIREIARCARPVRHPFPVQK